MLSLFTKAFVALLVVLLVALVTVLLVDERSPSHAVSLCKLTNGQTVVVKTIYESSLARILRYLMHDTLYAITLRNRVYVASDFLQPWNLKHEHEHVRQWYAMGGLRYTLTYLFYLVRDGYSHHPFEVLARHAAGEVPFLR